MVRAHHGSPSNNTVTAGVGSPAVMCLNLFILLKRLERKIIMLQQNNELQREIDKRRTFAIISHPDAGKTTMTEKLLLYGGAIRLAGSIKGRKTKRYAASDWMEMEQQRGISITSSVLQFSYNGYNINILDTPGHQDFSEDTYRTLTAADSALMIIDMAKGVEKQTVKLFKVCRMQGIPIFTFINKLDRLGREPLELLDEIENVLGIGSYPLNWPTAMASGSYGLYDRRLHKLNLCQGGKYSEFTAETGLGLEDQSLKNVLGAQAHQKLFDEISLLDGAGDNFSLENVRNGLLTPVFFGSAISGFGVETFLDKFLQMAAPPSATKSDIGNIEPTTDKFSGFIFKIQANMNPAHRDRIAFLRVCSGKFERDKVVKHLRTGRSIRLSQPQQFLAQNRNIIDEAYPGDIIGIFDPGIYQIGDTLSEDGSFQFERLPRFSPELFARVTSRDLAKYKQYHKGISQLTEEGAVQVFKVPGSDEIILGVVGELQFEVFQYRLQSEYGVDVNLKRLPYQLARWVKETDPEKLSRLHSFIVHDAEGQKVVLFESEYSLSYVKNNNPSINFLTQEECSDL
jgi:peptide chain release factor 3